MGKHNDALVRAMFTYDPVTGEVRRARTARGGKAQAGSLVGSATNLGYLLTQVEGVAVPVHHIAWFLVYGVWPNELDHIDRNRANNAITNLREATRSQNMANRNGYDLGIRGVHKEKPGVYRARGNLNGKRVHLGRYKTEEEAFEAFKKHHVKVYGEFSPYSGGV